MAFHFRKLFTKQKLFSRLQMLSSNPDPGKRDHALQKKYFPFQCTFEKATIVNSFTLYYFFISRHHNWELFKSYIWAIFSAGHNCLMSWFFKVTIVQCQNAQNKYGFFIAHLFNIFRAYNKCGVFVKTVWHFSGREAELIFFKVSASNIL